MASLTAICKTVNIQVFVILGKGERTGSSIAEIAKNGILIERIASDEEASR